jgi:hypothetical protein
MRAEMNLHSSVDWAIHAELLDADPVVSRHDRFSTAHTIPEDIAREHLMRLRAQYNNGAPFPGVLRTYGTDHVLSVRDNGEFVCDVCMETVIDCLRCGEALDPAYWAARWVPYREDGWQGREHEHYHSVCAPAGV